MPRVLLPFFTHCNVTNDKWFFSKLRINDAMAFETFTKILIILLCSSLKLVEIIQMKSGTGEMVYLKVPLSIEPIFFNALPQRSST